MKKVIDSLDGDLISAIRSNADLLSIRAILLEYKNRGIQAEEINELLADFLSYVQTSGVSDELEDKILEVLDIVTGFCSPFLKVWEN